MVFLRVGTSSLRRSGSANGIAIQILASASIPSGLNNGPRLLTTAHRCERPRNSSRQKWGTERFVPGKNPLKSQCERFPLAKVLTKGLQHQAAGRPPGPPRSLADGHTSWFCAAEIAAASKFPGKGERSSFRFPQSGRTAREASPRKKPKARRGIGFHQNEFCRAE